MRHYYQPKHTRKNEGTHAPGSRDSVTGRNAVDMRAIRHRLGVALGASVLALSMLGAPVPALAEGEADGAAPAGVEAQSSDTLSAAATSLSNPIPLTLGQGQYYQITSSDLESDQNHHVYFSFRTGSRTEDYRVGVAQTSGESELCVTVRKTDGSKVFALSYGDSISFLSGGSFDSQSGELQANTDYIIDVYTHDESPNWSGTGLWVVASREDGPASAPASGNHGGITSATPFTVGEGISATITRSDLGLRINNIWNLDYSDKNLYYLRYFSFTTGDQVRDYSISVNRNSGDSQLHVRLCDSNLAQLAYSNSNRDDDGFDPIWNTTVKLAANTTYYLAVNETNKGDNWNGTNFTVRVAEATTDLSGARVTASNQTYTGSALTPRPTVVLAGKTLKEGTDYYADYSNNVNAGTATITVHGKGAYSGTATGTFRITKASSGSGSGSGTQASSRPMYRLYNPNSGEHFYTAKTGERDNLTSLGWRYEGVGWNAPASGSPVYRLYNPNAGDHHYTTSVSERDGLVRVGWKYEGVGWYSGGSTPLYRQYNPNAVAGAHNYTTNKSENDYLVRVGWRAEGIGWYAVS